MPRNQNLQILPPLPEDQQPPFTLIKAPNGSCKRVHFQDGESLSDRIDKLTETLYQMDMEGKPTKRPYKPYITSPRRRGGSGFRPRGGHSSSDCAEAGPGREEDLEEEEDSPA